MQNITPMGWTIIAIIGALIIVAAIAWVYSRRRRREELRRHYGQEYDRTISEFRDRKLAESELARRQRRLRKLDIRELSAVERDDYSHRWLRIQERFVEKPGASVHDADLLVTEVMQARGYPTEDFRDRIDDVSAAYPDLAAKYREANAIAELNRQNKASTEDMREAVVLYRDLFQHLLGAEGRDEKLRRVS